MVGLLKTHIITISDRIRIEGRNILETHETNYRYVEEFKKFRELFEARLQSAIAEFETRYPDAQVLAVKEGYPLTNNGMFGRPPGKDFTSDRTPEEAYWLEQEPARSTLTWADYELDDIDIQISRRRL